MRTFVSAAVFMMAAGPAWAQDIDAEIEAALGAADEATGAESGEAAEGEGEGEDEDLPQIGDEALLRAIREPARLFGGEVSVDLSVRLIDESWAEFDALPLVQHALMRLWRQASSATQRSSGAW